MDVVSVAIKLHVTCACGYMWMLWVQYMCKCCMWMFYDSLAETLEAKMFTSRVLPVLRVHLTCHPAWTICAVRINSTGELDIMWSRIAS